MTLTIPPKRTRPWYRYWSWRIFILGLILIFLFPWWTEIIPPPSKPVPPLRNESADQWMERYNQSIQNEQNLPERKCPVPAKITFWNNPPPPEHPGHLVSKSWVLIIGEIVLLLFGNLALTALFQENDRKRDLLAEIDRESQQKERERLQKICNLRRSDLKEIIKLTDEEIDTVHAQFKKAFAYELVTFTNVVQYLGQFTNHKHDSLSYRRLLEIWYDQIHLESDTKTSIAPRKNLTTDEVLGTPCPTSTPEKTNVPRT